MKKTLFLCTLALGGTALASEIPVQGWSALGGGQDLIAGRLNGQVGWTLTGRAADVGVVFANTGAPLFNRSIGSFRPGWDGPIFVERVERLSDGQTRVRLTVYNAQPLFNGGRVELRRGSLNGPVADSDPIRLR